MEHYAVLPRLMSPTEGCAAQIAVRDNRPDANTRDPDRTNKEAGKYAIAAKAVAADLGIPSVDLWSKMQVGQAPCCLHNDPPILRGPVQSSAARPGLAWSVSQLHTRQLTPYCLVGPGRSGEPALQAVRAPPSRCTAGLTCGLPIILIAQAWLPTNRAAPTHKCFNK